MKDTVDPNRILQSFDSNELAGKHRRQLLLRFIEHVMADYRTHGRAFPWRETHDTYRVLLSELMLQQTQTSRVLPKYLQFVEQWPTFENLAGAQLVEVLRLWRGLGYNRRALALVEIAKRSEAMAGAARQRAVTAFVTDGGPVHSCSNSVVLLRAKGYLSRDQHQACFDSSILWEDRTGSRFLVTIGITGVD